MIRKLRMLISYVLHRNCSLTLMAFVAPIFVFISEEENDLQNLQFYLNE